MRTRYYSKSKYKNKKTRIDGIKFDSLREANRYVELKYKQKAGLISNLKLQVPFKLQPEFTDSFKKKHRAIIYIADFWYLDIITNEAVIEDCKGFKTAVYLLKKKMLLYSFRNLSNAPTFIET